MVVTSRWLHKCLRVEEWLSISKINSFCLCTYVSIKFLALIRNSGGVNYVTITILGRHDCSLTHYPIKIKLTVIVLIYFMLASLHLILTINLLLHHGHISKSTDRWHRTFLILAGSCQVTGVCVCVAVRGLFWCVSIWELQQPPLLTTRNSPPISASNSFAFSECHFRVGGGVCRISLTATTD